MTPIALFVIGLTGKTRIYDWECVKEGMGYYRSLDGPNRINRNPKFFKIRNPLLALLDYNYLTINRSRVRVP